MRCDCYHCFWMVYLSLVLSLVFPKFNYVIEKMNNCGYLMTSRSMHAKMAQKMLKITKFSSQKHQNWLKKLYKQKTILFCKKVIFEPIKFAQKTLKNVITLKTF